ncbi:MAG: primosomal protein N' [Prevotella ruminicola]|uniref:Replication restart protein PriA n=1 Tax=Xylanibacter ruminicola TaxID=839 RepID=A0A928BTD1_XYLRU|nr:primosomal protein N' [Xylanibacter ruminicola]
MNYADVILPVPLTGLFTYSVPEGMAVRVGMRVLVTFGRSKKYMGIVASLHNNKPEGYEVKPITQVMDAEPIVTDNQLKLWNWIADYYMSPIGEVYKAALPSGLKAEDGYRPKTELYIQLTPKFRSEQALHVAIDMLQRAPKQMKAFLDYLELSGWDRFDEPDAQTELTRDELLNEGHSLQAINALVQRGLLETYEKEVGRLNYGGDPHPENIKPLSPPQQEAFNQIQFSFLQKNVTLLHGVTSSGKTEIYIHLIQQALDKHQQVLYLLPEIALTVQMMQRLQRVFGNRLGIYHSKYSDAERVEIWQKQLSGHPYDVILGARSAVLLPFQNLGLIIIDEEHVTSYKQQDPAPRYHARSAAIMLAQMYGAKTLLGTATPSLETYHNAKTGKYGLVELTQRYKGIELPEIQVVDIKDLQHRKMMNGLFSPLLLSKVREALERGEQAIIFQNRRGYAPMIECKQCGWVPHCQHCDVSLTLHRNMNQLTCHYCGYTYQVPTECPACGCRELQTKGYGTEKIEDQVRDIFPEAHIARMDLDTTRTRNAYERIISDFSSGRTNLLIGTQMISKGLDFDKVSVVGILNADNLLNYPDFRAFEHAYMMMAQVSGRAGRKGKQGLVILQTKSPNVPIIQQVVHNDYAGFYRSLIAERQQFNYPPYRRLIYVYLKHRSDAVVETAGIEMASRLRQWFSSRVIGPDKPSIAKVKSLSIRKLIIKLELGINMAEVRKYLALAQQQMLQDKRYSSLQIYYDVDPL